MELLITFIMLGALGGVLRVLIHTDSLREALVYANSKWVLVGAITGLAYYFLHSEHNFPNSFMALVAGYAAADFIVAVAERLKKVFKALE